MRSLRRDERGISPIIATILLIAVTAVAAGVIAAFATNLFVSNPTVRQMGVLGATVYDYDNTAQTESYKNGNISIVIRVEAGTYRSIGDAQYGGTTVAISNPMTGFTASVSFPDNKSSWGTTMTGVSVNSFSGWSNPLENVIMSVTLSPDATGRLTTGSSISILLYPENIADAHQENYLFGATIFGRENSTKAWDEQDQLTVTFVDRDSASFSGYDARLYGSSWVI